jgi:putative transposase
MPARKRLPHSEAWDTIRQRCLWPEQKAYELLRPVVLLGDPPGERAEHTNANERTLRRQADRFDAQGMVSLFRPTKRQEADDHRSLPPPIRQAIVDLRVEYAGFSLHELAQIICIQYGRRPSRATIKQVLIDGPKPSSSGRRFAKYAAMGDAFQRRYAVVKLHTEGWTARAIAAYMQMPRSTTYELLRRFRGRGTEADTVGLFVGELLML